MQLTPDSIYAWFSKMSGLSPRDVGPAFDWFTLDIVHSVWRNSPIEDAHADRSIDLSDGAMLRINTWLTFKLRAVVAEWLMAHPLESIADLDQESLSGLLAEMRHILTDPNLVLPHGATIAQTAGAYLDPLLEGLGAKFEAMESMAEELSPASVVYLRAYFGWGECQWWWGTPAWPRIVAKLIASLDDPEADYWYGQFDHFLPFPAEVFERASFAAILEAAPWDLSPETCDWLALAMSGIQHIDERDLR